MQDAHGLPPLLSNGPSMTTPVGSKMRLPRLTDSHRVDSNPRRGFEMMKMAHDLLRREPVGDKTLERDRSQNRIPLLLIALCRCSGSTQHAAFALAHH
jgi:hypothetical protein